MLKIDFNFAKQFMTEIAEHDRSAVIKFYGKYDELTPANLSDYYDYRAIEDQPAAEAEFASLQRLGSKIGLPPFDVPDALTNIRNERRALISSKFQEREIRANRKAKTRNAWQLSVVILSITVPLAVAIWVMISVNHFFNGIGSAFTGADNTILGHTAKITGLIPCAGSAEAADAMDSNSFAGAVGPEGQGSVVSANSHQLRASGGIWLQEGWTVRFLTAQNIGLRNYTSLFVEGVPKDQKQYQGAICWLKTDDIQARVKLGDMKYPVESGVSAGPHVSQTKAPEKLVALPNLGQTYGTTDRELHSYKWSNANNTQESNIYDIPSGSGFEEIHLQYAKMPDGEKRVSDVGFHNFTSSYPWKKLKNIYVPKDAVRISLSAIGGNIQEIFTPGDAGTVSAFYHSRSVAVDEHKWGVPSCSEDSGSHGLLIVEGTQEHGVMTDAVVTDAALHWCGRSL